MTVRIRQLVSVTPGGVTPPPPAEMFFVQQPTNTETGQDFVPPIEVHISSGDSDVLTISIDSGTCSITPLTVTAIAGIALFEPLTAGAVGNGCRFRVHNESNPAVADIISNPFSVTPIPVVVTLEFSQQPTNTQTGAVITPPVTVSVSDGGSDSITVSGPCIAPQTVTAIAGLATFTLTAGAVTPSCILTAVSNTRPTIPAIQSTAFEVTSAPPVQQIQIVNGGNAFTIAQSTDGLDLIVNFPDGETTGATMRLYFAGVNFPSPEIVRFRTWTNGEWDPDTRSPLFADAFGQNRLLGDFDLVPGGTASGYSVRVPGATPPLTVQSSVSACFAVNGVNTASPVAASASTTVTTATVVQFPAPIAVNAAGMAISVITGTILNTPTPPAGYDGVMFLARTGVAWGMAVAWKFGAFTSENPAWLVSDGSQTYAIGFVAVRSL